MEKSRLTSIVRDGIDYAVSIVRNPVPSEKFSEMVENHFYGFKGVSEEGARSLYRAIHLHFFNTLNGNSPLSYVPHNLPYLAIPGAKRLESFAEIRPINAECFDSRKEAEEIVSEYGGYLDANLRSQD